MSGIIIDVTNIPCIQNKTSSKGNQPKWSVADRWIKQDFLGYEGLAEVLCSRVATALNFPYGVVTYEPCNIYNRGKTKTGCVSSNFLQQYTEVSLGNLLNKYFSVDPSILLNKKVSTAQKISETIQLVTQVKGLEMFAVYLAYLLRFDWLVMNEDRHYHNILFLYDETAFTYSPLFDNGGALLSDTYLEYAMDTPFNACIRNVQAKPFSTSFNKQVTAIEKLVGVQLQVHPITLKVSDLYDYYPTAQVHRAMKVLERQFRLFTQEENPITFI